MRCRVSPAWDVQHQRRRLEPVREYQRNGLALAILGVLVVPCLHLAFVCGIGWIVRLMPAAVGTQAEPASFAALWIARTPVRHQNLTVIDVLHRREGVRVEPRGAATPDDEALPTHLILTLPR